MRIAIVRPAGREKTDVLASRVEDLRNLGYQITVFDHPSESNWPYNSGSRSARAESFGRAVYDPSFDVIWCARGGYGCSDLLPLMDWSLLQSMAPKTLVGFSDFCAMHSAFWSKLGWPAIHAPMMGTDLWGDHTNSDVAQTLNFLNKGIDSITIQVKNSARIRGQGILFGGCLSVLTNLIGTPYLPKSLDNHILFFEDTDENPGRIIRNLQQWLQAGLLRGVKALVLGNFRNSKLDEHTQKEMLVSRLEEYLCFPVLQSDDFGHKAPNTPAGVGYHAVLGDDHLTWGMEDAISRLQQS